MPISNKNAFFSHRLGRYSEKGWILDDPHLMARSIFEIKVKMRGRVQGPFEGAEYPVRRILKQAKNLAAESGSSVSAIFSQYIQSITTAKKRSIKPGPLTKKLTGIITLGKKEDYHDIIAESMAEKYGL